jgi:hypothetical protein
MDVSTIEVEFEKTIDMIEGQEIVAPWQENANGDAKIHAQIDGGDVLNLICYN